MRSWDPLFGQFRWHHDIEATFEWWSPAIEALGQAKSRRPRVVYALLSFMAHEAGAEICSRHASRFPLFNYLVLGTLGPPPLDLYKDHESPSIAILVEELLTSP